MTHVRNERRRPPAWLLGLILAVAVFAVLLVLVNALGFGDDPALETEGGPAGTDGLTFVFWDGGEGSFEDFRGQPVVLNFWASWCPACVAEMPDFESVHQILGDRVQFVGADMQDLSRSDAQRLVNQTGVSYTLIEDPQGELYAFFGGISMPTTVFIDAKGEIVETHSGTIFADDLEARLREVFDL
jgi:cytochrome c biogenesis protein CcmG, thiol:disulfide interchange protein DsbE